MADKHRTLLEVMERTGTTNKNLAIAYIRDALDKLSSLIDSPSTVTTIDIVSGTKEYDLPTDFRRLLGVYRKIDEDTYKEIKELRDKSYIKE